MSIPKGPRQTLVTIQAPTEVADALGQLRTTWATVATMWCARLETKGRTMENAKQTKEAAYHVLETAYHPELLSITPLHRVILPSGKVCGITRVDNDGDLNEHFVIWCVEMTPQP